eukprot:Em0006g350a
MPMTTGYLHNVRAVGASVTSGSLSLSSAAIVAHVANAFAPLEKHHYPESTSKQSLDRGKGWGMEKGGVGKQKTIAALNSNKHSYTMRSTTREDTQGGPQTCSQTKERGPAAGGAESLSITKRKWRTLQDWLKGLETKACQHCRGEGRAVGFEPSLSDTYWHRHLLHLLQANHQAALDDLAALLRVTKKHYGALRSKIGTDGLREGCEYFTQLLGMDPNDTMTPILRATTLKHFNNLTVAIHLEPAGAQAFYQRACLL